MKAEHACSGFAPAFLFTVSASSLTPDPRQAFKGYTGQREARLPASEQS
jgi:hypothetical protein